MGDLLHMIVNIRGTNGSGKSTVVRGLISRYGARPVYGVLGVRRPEGYLLGTGDWFVAGPYMAPSHSGGEVLVARCGMDGFLELLSDRLRRGHSVIFEGMTINSYGKVGTWLAAHASEAVVCFMSTPLETCLERIEDRRRAAGNSDPIDPRNVRSKHREVQRARTRFLGGRVRVVDLPHEDPAGAVAAIMEEAV